MASDDDPHTFARILEGDAPGESRLRCSCGWTSVSAPGHLLDLDVHIADVNGISFEEQKQRTTKALRAIGIACPDPRPLN